MKKYILVILFGLGITASAQQQMNRPYVDDKLIHFGFSIGLGSPTFSITPVDTLLGGTPEKGSRPNKSDVFETFENKQLYVRSDRPGVAFSVGLITDLRLSRHLNLRFTPDIQFGWRNLRYKYYKDDNPQNEKEENIATFNYAKKRINGVPSIPISFPLSLKWSAEREGNYRPYVIAGGGISHDFSPSMLKMKDIDCFLHIGFGCDLYFSWFKLCPEIKYQIGVIDALDHNGHPEGTLEPQFFYSDAIGHLRTHNISIVFNFE